MIPSNPWYCSQAIRQVYKLVAEHQRQISDECMQPRQPSSLQASSEAASCPVAFYPLGIAPQISAGRSVRSPLRCSLTFVGEAFGMVLLES